MVMIPPDSSAMFQVIAQSSRLMWPDARGVADGQLSATMRGELSGILFTPGAIIEL